MTRLVLLLVLALAFIAGQARGGHTEIPTPLLGRFDRTVTDAAWRKHGLELPNTRMDIIVRSEGEIVVGYFGHGIAYAGWSTDWHVKGSTLWIGATPVCAGRGRYRYRLRGATLTLTKTNDPCTDRVVVFAGKWQKKNRLRPPR